MWRPLWAAAVVSAAAMAFATPATWTSQRPRSRRLVSSPCPQKTRAAVWSTSRGGAAAASKNNAHDAEPQTAAAADHVDATQSSSVSEADASSHGQPESQHGLAEQMTTTRADDAALRRPRDDAPVTTTRPPATVVALLAGVFLNLLGFTMAGPITPALGEHFGLEDGSRVGMLTSAYPLGMLFGLLVWPHVSDLRGMRKPILVGSLAGAGLGLGLQASCLALDGPLWAFLALRALSGLFAGSSPVGKAFLADVAQHRTRDPPPPTRDGDRVDATTKDATTHSDLPRFLAYREASATLAFIVGPSLGGVLYHVTGSLAAVVGATSLASIAAAGIVGAVAKAPPPSAAATPKADDPTPGGAEEGAFAKSSTRLLLDARAPASCPLGARLLAAVATIVAVSSLENAGSSTWDAFGALVAHQRYEWGPRTIGLLLTAGACCSFAVSTAAFGPVSRRIGVVPTCVLGLASIAMGLHGVGAAGSDPAKFVLAVAMYQLGKPLYAPCLPTLLLRCVPPRRRGLAMGLDSIANTLARTIAPVALGAVLHARGAAACFHCAGTLVAAAALLATLRGLQVRGVGPNTSNWAASYAGHPPSVLRRQLLHAERLLRRLPGLMFGSRVDHHRRPSTSLPAEPPPTPAVSPSPSPSSTRTTSSSPTDDPQGGPPPS